MTKSLKNLWGRFLFQDRGILPTKRLLIFFLLFSGGMTFLAVWGISWMYVLIANCLFLLLSLLDLFRSPKKTQLQCKRTIPEEMERGLTYSVQVKINNASPYRIKFRFVDGLSQTFQTSFPVHGELSGHDNVTSTYQTIAKVRGDYHVEKLYVRFHSLLGLWEKQTTVVGEDVVKVIPDLTETRHYLENAQRFLVDEGVHIRKKQSDAGEFAKIRSYVVGDDPRKINWRQTAKLQEVMTNEYEPEHGKYITILIDCGRMMGAELKKGNRLEKVLEASITVAAAALKKGDYVSVLAFSKDIKVYLPPEKGNNHLQKILHTIYNLQVDASESNYASVFQYLRMHQNKRSLVLLFSDVGTFLHEESALQHVKKVRKKHLFLMMGMEDEALLKTAKLESDSSQQAMIKSMAQQQLHIKKIQKNKWEKQGIQMVEVKEERLAIAAVSHYIDLLNRGLI